MIFRTDAPVVGIETVTERSIDEGPRRDGGQAPSSAMMWRATSVPPWPRRSEAQSSLTSESTETR